MEAHDVVIRYVSALGFPIVAAGFMAFLFYKAGGMLLARYMTTLDANTDEMKKQTASLSVIEKHLPTVCRAHCPDEVNCENFAPRKRPPA